MWDKAGAQAMAVAGRIIAGATHDIKNKLAVLQEQGALIRDLAEAAAAGRTLDPDRVGLLGGRMIGKVKETDEIIKRLNRFAHSADDARGSLDPVMALSLMIEMHRRQADMKPVKIVVIAEEKSINIETRPMFLLTVLYACLEASTAGAPPGADIRAEVIEDGSEIRFEFSWPGSNPAGPPPPLELAAAVSAQVRLLTPGLVLTVPTRSGRRALGILKSGSEE